MKKMRRVLVRTLTLVGHLGTIHWVSSVGAGVAASAGAAAFRLPMPVLLGAASATIFAVAGILAWREQRRPTAITRRSLKSSLSDRRAITSSAPPARPTPTVLGLESVLLRGRLQELLTRGVELRDPTTPIVQLGLLYGPATGSFEVDSWEHEVALALRNQPLLLARFQAGSHDEWLGRPVSVGLGLVSDVAHRLDYRLKKLEQIIKQLPAI